MLRVTITVIPASLRPNASSLTSTWDFDNRLANATTGSTTVSHQYDALDAESLVHRQFNNRLRTSRSANDR